MIYYLELRQDHDSMVYLYAEWWTVPHGVCHKADRIWEERTDGSVQYIKLRSRWLSDMSRVDRKEFAWVKLRSISLKDWHET